MDYRKKVIQTLEIILKRYPTLDKDEIFALRFAINSIKVDRAYELMHEKVDFVEIPKGATNSDMFKAVFGYDPATDAVICNKEDWCGASEPCNYCISNPNNIGREEDWWNAPYKAESEE